LQVTTVLRNAGHNSVAIAGTTVAAAAAAVTSKMRARAHCQVIRRLLGEMVLSVKVLWF
jgi:hypothetical protein